MKRPESDGGPPTNVLKTAVNDAADESDAAPLISSPPPAALKPAVSTANSGRHSAFVTVLCAQSTHDVLFWLFMGVAALCLAINHSLASAAHGADAPGDASCERMLNQGSWMSSGVERFGVWQPLGCATTTYTSDRMHQCFQTAPVYVVGDSVARYVYNSLGDRIAPMDYGKLHADSVVEFGTGSALKFYWDAYLNSTVLQRIGDPEPALFIVTAGPWFMKNEERDLGLDHWNASTRRILSLFGDAHLQTPKPPTLMMLPVHPVQELKLSEPRQAITSGLVQHYNEVLAANILSFHATYPHLVANVKLPLAPREMFADSRIATQDGLHLDRRLYGVEVDLMLNYACNDKLFSGSSEPMPASCCVQYPSLNWKQVFALLVLVYLGPLSFITHKASHYFPLLKSVQNYMPDEKVAKDVTKLGGAMVLLLLADRSTMFMKMQKHFDIPTFVAMTLTMLAAGLFTISTNKDDSFLNRHLTDEWKGWMQIAILIYHYTGASSVSGIYNFMRILVAGYLFMTGYGHFLFFLKKADFGLMRVAKVMTRLNFFTFVLVYCMNSCYQAYYFSPLVSLWFGVIWVTMAVRSSMNSLPWFMCMKIVVAATICWLLVAVDGVFEWLTGAFAVVTGSSWDAHEWLFRYQLDRFIIFIGMGVAYASVVFKDRVATFWQAQHVRLEKFAWIGGLVVILGYFIFECSTDKFDYNRVQPYISFLPLLAFVGLRNISKAARANTSWFYCFIGRISLETFIIQFHFWLALDTKGLLVVVPQSWLTNFVIVTYLFIYLSNCMANVTTSLTEVVVGDKATLARRSLIFTCALIAFNHLPA